MWYKGKYFSNNVREQRSQASSILIKEEAQKKKEEDSEQKKKEEKSQTISSDISKADLYVWKRMIHVAASGTLITSLMDLNTVV